MSAESTDSGTTVESKVNVSSIEVENNEDAGKENIDLVKLTGNGDKFYNSVDYSKAVDCYEKRSDVVAVAAENNLLYVAANDGKLCTVGNRDKKKDMGWQLPVVV